jgi:hypothetical protein
MPMDATLTDLGDLVVEGAQIVIAERGGGEIVREGNRIFQIPVEQPANVAPLSTMDHQGKQARDEYLPALKQRLLAADANSAAAAQAAYLALCLGEAEVLSSDAPEAWTAALAALANYPALVRAMEKAPAEAGKRLQGQARKAGLISKAE